MQVIRVRGGNDLRGSVEVEGAKNSVLKLMAACVLCQGIFKITRVPNISDVLVMKQVLERLGADVRLEDKCLTINTQELDKFETPYELVNKMRASISVLGPLLARFGKAQVSMPGGCQIGARKLDLHFSALSALGVDFKFEHGTIYATAPQGLIGNKVNLEFPSVGATENLMMAAVRAQGCTEISNAAREPEIVDLANFLNEMGAKISGAGSPIISIEGVQAHELHSATHETVGDRIEAGTFLVAGALSGGPVEVRGVKPEHLGIVLRKFEDMGCVLELSDNSICISRSQPLKPVTIQTLPFPGFPTDMQAQFMVLAAFAEGNSIITENVFENRFMFAAELARMGVEVNIEGHHALVKGCKELSGAPVASTDLRGGASLVLAGLMAKGQTEVSGVEHIMRGYERYVEKLQSLGANLELCELEV